MTYVSSIIVCAVASGAETFQDIGLYAMCMEEWLKSILELPNGVPSHDTSERIIRWLDPDEFRNCFVNWVRGVVKLIEKIHHNILGCIF